MSDGLSQRAADAPVGGGVVGAANFLAVEASGVSLTLVAQGGPKHPQAAGVAVAQAPATLLVNESAGLALVPTVSGSSVGSQSAGVAQTVTANLGAFPQAPGAKLQLITYNLTQDNGAVAASSTGTWATPANAQGKTDGAFATNANTVLAAASGTLSMTYAAQPNKTPLTITNVTLNRYDKYVPGLVGPGTLQVDYSVNGGTSWTNVFNAATAFDNSATPAALDITAAIAGSWTAVAAFQMRYIFTAASSATVSTVSVDAVELVVTANTTQTP